MKFSAFVGASSTSQSPITDQERTMNLFVERVESHGATAQAALYPTPGVEAFATAVAVGTRAMFTDDQTARCFAVIGASFCEIDAAGTVTVRGTVAVDANPATISTNGAGGGQLLITSGDKAYSYDLLTNTLTEELSSGATQGAVLYGYGLVFDKASGRVRLSDLFDLTTWDPTQFFERTIGTDPWQAMAVTPYGHICLPGTHTGEFWYNAGTFPIPFAPDPSGNFAYGCGATFSIQQLGDTLAWLGTTIEGGFTVVRTSGFSPQRISTHPVEFALAGYADLTDAIGQTYGDQGHVFYVLTCPTANATWAYDTTTSLWAERGTWISEENRYIYWRPVFHTVFAGHHLMGDRDSSVIYRMASTLRMDVEGRPIRWLRRSPAAIHEHERLFCTAFELLMESGVGTVSGQGVDPQVLLRVSRDGGRTWGNEQSCSVGRMGEYAQRVIFQRIGMARSFVFEVVGTDPVPYRITEAYLRFRAGRRAAA